MQVVYLGVMLGNYLGELGSWGRKDNKAPQKYLSAGYCVQLRVNSTGYNWECSLCEWRIWDIYSTSSCPYSCMVTQGCSSSWSLGLHGQRMLLVIEWLENIGVGNHLQLMSVGSYILFYFVCSLYLYLYDCSLMKHVGIDKGREKARLDKENTSRGFHSHLFPQAYLQL